MAIHLSLRPVLFVAALGLSSLAGAGPAVEIGATHAIPVESLSLATDNAPGAFPLVQDHSAASLVASQEDAEVVRLALAALAGDIEKVSGQKPAMLAGTQSLPAYSVLAGTLGKSSLIDGLVAAGKIKPDAIRGQWERYIIQVVEAPLPGVKQAVVIAGSDRRGTAYGILSLSRAIGVSPWVWWANVTPEPRATLWLGGEPVTSTAPGVQYRGFFLNDEDWGLKPWAAANQDPEIKDIGPKTYGRICELLLRLRANFIWPAMHSCTKAFYYYPENPATADRYAIVVGSSHCEPMLRNNVDEWKPFMVKSGWQWKPGGKEADSWENRYRYDTNSEQVNQYWQERVRQSAGYESVYTLGMRGLHDGNMIGPKTMPEKLQVMGQAIKAQQAMLAEGLKRPKETIPQLFCPYKEVLGIYQAGLPLPPEVTLVWPDDNHGYLRQLSTPEEQKRSGRSGLYYHMSYYGAPEDFLWLCSSSPGLLAFELHKALATGADRLWVFNVGDIKPAEMEIEFALDLAWNPSRWTPANAHQYAKEWATRTFGDAVAEEIAAIKKEYYALAQTGKPEHVWRVAYGRAEAATRRERYNEIASRAQKLASKIPARLQDAYFQLVLYPTLGATRMNDKVFSAKLGDMPRAEAAQAEIQALTRKYNEDIAGGQWCGIMDWQPRKQAAFADPQAILTAQSRNTKKSTAPSAPLTDERVTAEVDLAHPAGSLDAPQAALTWMQGLGAAKAVSRLPLVGPAYESKDAPWVDYREVLNSFPHFDFLKIGDCERGYVRKSGSRSALILWFHVV